MNTRILRMCTHWRSAQIRQVPHLGSLQPVHFTVEDGRVKLRIEDVREQRDGERRWVWTVYDLLLHKAEAKRAFAHLEDCHGRGVPSDAYRIWAAEQEATEDEAESVPSMRLRSLMT